MVQLALPGDAIADLGLAVLAPEQIATELVPALARIDPTNLWLHIDVEVLDPAEFAKPRMVRSAARSAALLLVADLGLIVAGAAFVAGWP